MLHVQGVRSYARRYRSSAQERWLKARLRLTTLNRGMSVDLGRPVIMTLTSHPARFRTLVFTLRCLLSQSLRPNRLMLWLSEAGAQTLPRQVRNLQASGLEIFVTEDLGPFTKFYEARRRFPDAHLVTVDDDVVYGKDMLRQLVEGHVANERAVIMHRSRLAGFTDMGPTPYTSWPLCYESNLESDRLLPMGVGGAFYPSGSIPDQALDKSTFQRLTPRNDDLWLFWMVRQAGFTSRLVAKPREPDTWRGTQDSGLWVTTNMQGPSRNDEFAKAMWDAFGAPPSTKRLQESLQPSRTPLT